MRDEGRGTRDEGLDELAESTPPRADSVGISRRRALKVISVAPLAAAAAGAQQQTPQQAQQPARTPHPPAAVTAPPARSQSKRHFFTAKEWRTVRVLADDIIPKDERSGSATDAGVPEYIDFHMSVQETSDESRVAMRGGLRWLDTESRKRFGVPYASARTAQRHQILDDISWPGKIAPGMNAGAAFFNNFRSMAGAGFFSSAMGWKDLQYMGNVWLAEWKGCPPEALKKLGVSYE